jgi:hypothetical protein
VIDSKRIHFHCDSLSQHLHRKDQPMQILPPHEDPLDACQRAILDSYPSAAFQERMRLGARTTFDRSPDGIDFGSGNRGWLASV